MHLFSIVFHWAKVCARIFLISWQKWKVHQTRFRAQNFPLKICSFLIIQLTKTMRSWEEGAQHYSSLTSTIIYGEVTKLISEVCYIYHLALLLIKNLTNYRHHFAICWFCFVIVIEWEMPSWIEYNVFLVVIELP